MSAITSAIRTNVIGEQCPIETPFGLKPLVYADYTASGRSLAAIETFIQDKVLPYYANTHTETSYTGRQTGALREQARTMIREAVNGGDDDQVIFCGPGATAAIHKIIDILNLRLPADLAERCQLMASIPAEERPIVFLGSYEHHSNELPWRESIADIEVIPLSGSGQLDLDALSEALARHADRKLKIGSFSAASNVTGVKTDTAAVAAMLHEHEALSFWDYAAAGPYVGIDMSDKDAVFISPHKFIGGPGTPGLLIAKRQFMNNSVPAIPGGGTVMYVTPESHRFIDDHERREEGGTPAIVESIRAGLVFNLQQQVGTDEIERRENDFYRRALARWQACDNIEILGNPDVPRLSIVSFQIQHEDKYLHYGLVVALLNDLFGIQSRGGCSCAGPYGHSLLGMDMDYSKALEREMVKGQMVLRPGWVRLNFNYFIDEETFEYIVRAVELVAEHGWRLQPYYCFDEGSGTWSYQKQRPELAVSLADFDICGEACEVTDVAFNLAEVQAEAEAILRVEPEGAETFVLSLNSEAEDLRWFYLPSLDGREDSVNTKLQVN